MSHHHHHHHASVLGAVWAMGLASGAVIAVVLIAGVTALLAAGAILWGVIVLARAGWRQWRA